MTAFDIREHVDKLVVGQNEAKKQLSMLLSMHVGWSKRSDQRNPSPNAIIIGPTGCGKTHSIRSAAEILQLPFVVVDSTALIPAGYKNGITLETVLDQLIDEAGRLVEQRPKAAPAEAATDTNRTKPRTVNENDRSISNPKLLASRGVLFFDEFDKLAAKERESNNLGYHFETQRRLLKLVEGAIMTSAKGVVIDTAGILVLTGGAFQGIGGQDIRGKRNPQLRAELARTKQQESIVSDDIIQYGFMPELVARLPVLITYEQLDTAALLQILNNPAISPLQVWVNHFSALGKGLVFEGSFLTKVADRAARLGLGARGLQQVLFPCLAGRAYDFETNSTPTLTLNASDLI